MIVYGFAKDYKYDEAGRLLIQVRIPAIHGPYVQTSYKGSVSHMVYTLDADLPFYPAILLPKMPTDGDVVLLESTNSQNSDFVVMGLTGGSYQTGILLGG